MGPSMLRAWLALALFAVGFLLFLLAPLAVLALAGLVYAVASRRGRRRGNGPAEPARRVPVALPAPRSAGFGGGVG